MSSVALSRYGQGKNLLLIHGFPMTSKIWRSFIPVLSEAFQVITIDLPGFGESPLLPVPFTLDDVAREVLAAMDRERIRDAVVVGHSLGGYVALAMAAQRIEFFKGLVLLHSTAEADGPEKKESRDKAIEFIKGKGAEAFTRTFSSSVFQNPNHPDVPFVREMNLAVNSETLTAYTAAMRDRPDRMDLLKSFERPLMFVAGAHDQGIPVESIQAQAANAKHHEVHVLKDQKHMSLIEDVRTSSSLVYDFARRCN